jgi:hypothetical protein
MNCRYSALGASGRAKRRDGMLLVVVVVEVISLGYAVAVVMRTLTGYPFI